MKTFIIILSVLLFYNCSNKKNENNSLALLNVSEANPHLIETVTGKPIFLNNFTLWKLIEHGTRKDIEEILDFCKENKYNMISAMILGIATWDGADYEAGVSPYGDHAFEKDLFNYPDPLRPITKQGNDFNDPGQYDFWDHVEYVIDIAAQKGLYIGLHPAWGNWFSGFVHGQKPEDILLFDDYKAYQYGHWLGKRFGEKKNIIWMVGGDRSAVYDSRTRWYTSSDVKDYRHLYRAMAEGLADGVNNINNQDGKADYGNIMISYHPRKWGPNSSDWFHMDPWLLFNSIQDTPADQMVSVPNDYILTPVKPTWLYEPVYEGAIHAWGVRYQAYQTVLMGGFGHTYGSDIWEFKSNWREYITLPGNEQMKYLYEVVREIWTDKEFLNRMPDQSLIIGDTGKTYGRGINAVTDFETKENQSGERSDHITAMRGKDGKWALVYSANGREITLDSSLLHEGELNAYWFNPRNGKWQVNGSDYDDLMPFEKNIKTGKGSLRFTPPGGAKNENDWVLVLK